MTLWANKQKYNQEQSTANTARQHATIDRGFNACVDVLQTGHLLYNEVNGLWWDLTNNEPPDVLSARSEPYDAALRNYAANAVARMAMPPMALSDFNNYIKAVRVLSDEVHDWKIVYLKSSSPLDHQKKSELERKCKDLQDDLVAKRDSFAHVGRTLAGEDVWPNAQ